MRMAAGGNMRSSTVTSHGHLWATESHPPTKKSCFLMSLLLRLRRARSLPGRIWSCIRAQLQSLPRATLSERVSPRGVEWVPQPPQNEPRFSR